MQSKLLWAILPIALVINMTATTTSNAQSCAVSNLTIKVNSINSTSTSCSINATISWLQASNPANKFTNVHIWTAASYPTPPFSYATPSYPKASNLAGSLGTFVLDNPGGGSPSFDSGYPADNTLSSSKLIAKTSSTVIYKKANYLSGIDSFNVSNVNIALSGTASCSNNFLLVGDVWSSQSNNDQTVQCFNENKTFVTPDVNIAGIMSCTTPRQFNLTISTANTGVVNFTYTVYADAAQTGSYSPSDPSIYSGAGSAAAGAPYISGLITNSAYPNYNLIVVAQVSGNPVSTFGLITNSCSTTLPLSLLSFNAKKMSDQDILLTWETSIEQNTKGFQVQRKNGNGSFEDIAFIASKAPQGNSNNLLSYQYEDANLFNGEVEYRLAEIDLDGRQVTSPIIMVNGSSSKNGSVLVYPTPTNNGNVIIAFDNTDRKDLLLIDMSGKIIKKASGIASNSYPINGLAPGIYFIKVINQSTGDAVERKIISR